MMHEATPSSSSSPMSSPAGETLHKYADLLRVGQLSINGREVSWDTKAATTDQLESFRSAFVRELKQLSVTNSLEDDVLEHSAHLVCKALSINYVLNELLSVLRRKLRGKYTDLYKISDNGASSNDRPEYGVVVEPTADGRGQMVKAFVKWRSEGNIVCCDARTAKMKVKGTLYAVETKFPLAPDENFHPEYTLQVETKSSRLARWGGAMKHLCGSGVSGARRALDYDKLLPEEPFTFQSEAQSAGPMRMGFGVDADGSEASSERSSRSSRRSESGASEGSAEPVPEVINIRSDIACGMSTRSCWCPETRDSGEFVVQRGRNVGRAPSPPHISDRE